MSFGFQQKPVRQKSDNCKVKVKQGSDGSKTITFQGNCSKEQLSMAKEAMGADKIEQENA